VIDLATRMRTCALVLFTAVLQACAGGMSPGDDGPPAGASLPPIPPDAVPRAEPRSRYGNPSSYVVLGRRYHVMSNSQGYVKRGIASWYGRKFHGRRTSSGEPYDMHAMTAAHKSLPLPTYVQVTNLKNGRTTVLRVNDRGPFHDNRIIDLSYAAARKLEILGEGTGLVEVRALTPGQDPLASVIPVSTSGSTPTPVPAAAPPAAATGVSVPGPTPAPAPTLYLQAGAFSERGNAERLRTRLAAIPGARVLLQDVVLEGQHLYRVRLGPMASVADADRMSASVVSAGMAPPRIVVE